MAAGIGSRYGGGVKQLAAVGARGELIIDFSIYDALRAGFDKIVFIIRRDIEDDFKEIIGDRVARIAEIKYVYQELSDLPEGFTVPEGRSKPWGTGQAILACKDVIDGPFAVINADDFYGSQAYVKAYSFLATQKEQTTKTQLCMVDFTLGKTLSSNGKVTRGICSFSDDGRLTSIKETYNIELKNGFAVSADTGACVPLEARASMNFWGFYPDIFPILEAGFKTFLASLSDGGRQEFLLPSIVDGMLKGGYCDVTALSSTDEWFGVTYKEDIEEVRASIAKLVNDGVYPQTLFLNSRKRH